MQDSNLLKEIDTKKRILINKLMKLVNKAICDHLCSLALQLHVHICDFTKLYNFNMFSLPFVFPYIQIHNSVFFAERNW